MMGDNISFQGRIKITFLGTGTSTGVPMIGCDCETCLSDDERDKRLRASVLLEWEEEGSVRHILIDTATDLRQQALANAVPKVDAVLFTHPHADHIHGIDELRSFNFIQKKPIPCYGSAYTVKRIKKMFDYIFDNSQQGGGKPRLELEAVTGPLGLLGRTVEPLPAMHGEMEVFGYRIGGFAYLTDCNHVPQETMAKLHGLDVLVIGAVQYTKHVTHFSIGQAVELAQKVAPRQAYLTHVNHRVLHSRLREELPDGISVAYDGLTITV